MIAFDGLTFRYPDAARPVLRDVTVTVPDGDLCLVVGRTGTGKSTLLQTINTLVPQFTGGELTGDVRVAGRSTRALRPNSLAELVGYVGQVPVNGFVTDTVAHEVAYGMEQLGLTPVAMRKRVEETLDLLGIAELRSRPLAELSGGEQQRVAIAAVLAAQPRVLVLDEPTSALDPTAAQDVLAAITTLVHEVGLTVVLAEHRLERVMQAADSVLWLPGDGTVEWGPTATMLARADVTPPLTELARTVGWAEVPLSVREARRWVAQERLVVRPPATSELTVGDSVLVALGVTVDYGPVRAVDGVDLTLSGGVTVLMGRNGSGKSSLLWALAGALASDGEVRIGGMDPHSLTPAGARRLVALVPQAASDLLYLPTVADECDQADRENEAPSGTTRTLLGRLGGDLADDADPRDLSEGQRLMLVLAIQLAASPRVVLLDEPTRGLDYAAKRRLGGVVRTLADGGTTVLVSTHDVEFAAAVSERMLVMAQGQLIADGPTRSLATSSPVYAPQMAKVFAPLPLLTPDDMARGLR